MKIYSIKVKDIVLDVLSENGLSLLMNQEDFENAINSFSPFYYEECYLIMQGLKMHLFEFLMLNATTPLLSFVSALRIYFHMEEDEALFLISIFQNMIHQTRVMIEIANIDEVEDVARSTGRVEDLHVLAMAYYDGVGVHQDFEKAFALFQELAEMGDDEAYYYLGYMSQEGLGTEVNLRDARFYYEEGCDRDENECLFALGNLQMQYGEYEAALEDLKDSDDPRSYALLGKYYQDQENYEEAIQTYAEGCKVFDVESLRTLGQMYLDGDHCVKDEELGLRYLSYAYYQFDVVAARVLGMALMEGKGTDVDERKGMEILTYAMLEGDDLSRTYLLEHGVEIHEEV